MSSSVSADDRSTLLFLPGLDGTGRLLFTQTRLLDQYRVLAQSYPHDREHDYRSLALDAAKRVEEENAGRPLTVVAESFGGGVAIEMATSFSQLVDRLVLVNTFAKFPAPWLAKVGQLLRYGPTRPSPPWTRRLRERFLFADDLPRSVRDAWWDQVADVPTSTLGHRVRLIAGLDRLDDLSRISASTTVIVALDDRLVLPSAGHELARRIPDARLVEVTGGHTVLSHPDFDLCDYLA